MLNDIFKNAQKFVTENSALILAGFGVVGTVTTAVLSAKAAVKANDILEFANKNADMMDQPLPTRREQAVLVWDIWLPPVASGALTIGAIIGSNYISHRRAVAMATAYAIVDRVFDEYRDKVKEKVGERKEQGIRDSIAQDHVDRKPASTSYILPTKRGEVLCYDTWSGRYFYSEMEELRRAQNDINHTILNSYYASLTDFYDRIGLDRTKFSDEVGWNSDRLLDLTFSTTMSDDQRPCIVVDFSADPIRHYHRIQ